jgi:hypothetical protein
MAKVRKKFEKKFKKKFAKKFKNITNCWRGGEGGELSFQCLREVVVTPTVVWSEHLRGLWSEHLRGLWSEHLHQIMCSHNTYTSCVVTRPTLNYVQSEDLH